MEENQPYAQCKMAAPIFAKKFVVNRQNNLYLGLVKPSDV